MFAACAGEKSTPTATFKATTEAAKNKDVNAIKANLSQGSIEFLNNAAKIQKIPLDEAITNQLNLVNFGDKQIETRNEMINGDDATLEIKNPITGAWDKLYFTQENGRWKIAFDKLYKELMKKFEEQNAK